MGLALWGMRRTKDLSGFALGNGDLGPVVGLPRHHERLVGQPKVHGVIDVVQAQLLSFGLQIGGEAIDLVMFFMTERGARSLLETRPPKPTTES